MSIQLWLFRFLNQKYLQWRLQLFAALWQAITENVSLPMSRWI
jgi:hypothetical protein